MKQVGMRVATVGTGRDSSHAPARRAYEKAGFNVQISSVWLLQKLWLKPETYNKHNLKNKIKKFSQIQILKSNLVNVLFSTYLSVQIYNLFYYLINCQIIGH